MPPASILSSLVPSLCWSRCVKMNCNLGFKNKGAGWKFGVMSSIKGGREEYRRSLLAAALRPHSLISFISNK